MLITLIEGAISAAAESACNCYWISVMGDGADTCHSSIHIYSEPFAAMRNISTFRYAAASCHCLKYKNMIFGMLYYIFGSGIYKKTYDVSHHRSGVQSGFRYI